MISSYLKKIKKMFLSTLAVSIVFVYPLSVSASETESTDLPEGSISSSSELPDQTLPEDDVKTEDSDEEAVPSTDADNTNREEESSSAEAYYGATYSGNESGRWRASGSRWWFETADGSYLANGIYVIDGTNFAFDGSGWMITGWYMQNRDDGTYDWYYFQSGGAMAYGWQAIGGAWYYLDPETGVMQTGWKEISGSWYCLDGSGAMKTGWIEVDGEWYYLSPSGVRATGWQAIGGAWYYLDPNDGFMYENGSFLIDGQNYHFQTGGAMLTGWYKQTWDDGTYDWYYFQSGGAMAHGWQAIGGTWYYLDPTDGYMYENVGVKIDGQSYYFLSGGAMHTGWRKYDRHDGTYDWYYYQPNGVKALGWQAIDGHWYYFQPTLGGWMVHDGVWGMPDGKRYAFGPNGEMLAEQWYKHPQADYWLYLDKDGTAHDGWLELDGKRYYFSDTMLVRSKPEDGYDGMWEIDGENYAFGPDGAMVTGWKTIRNKDNFKNYYFFDSDGKAHKGWLYENNAWYYFDLQGGFMYCDRDPRDRIHEIDGKKYAFATDGKMITGWHEWDGEKYFFNSDGSMHMGWLTYNNDRYYLSTHSGKMYFGDTYKIDGEYMTFDADGKLISSK